MGRSLALLADVELRDPVDGQRMRWSATRRRWVLAESLVYLAADVSNALNPAAWADVTGLSWSVEVGTYLFWFWLTTSTAATTTRQSLGVNGPTKSRLIVNVDQPNANGGTGRQMNSGTAYDTMANVPAASSGATPMPATVWGLVTFTAAGTFTLRQKSNVNSSAVSCLIGSMGEIAKVA